MSQVITTATIFLVTAVIALLGFFGSAFGYENPDMDIEFKELQATQKRSGIQLQYTVKKGDWRKVKSAGIQPRLNLYTRTHHGNFDFRYSVPLNSRSGTIGFPAEIRTRNGKQIEIEVVGFSGFNRISRSTFGERCQPRLRLSVRGKSPNHPPKGYKKGKGHGHGHGSNFTAKLVEVCGSHSHSSRVSDCVSRAAAFPQHQAVEVVKACGAHTRYSSEFNRCMDKAAKLSHTPAATVNACGAATKWTSELNHCLDDSAKFVRHSPASTIKACDAATKWNSDFRRCVKQSATLGRNGDAVIRACSNASRFSSEFHQCVKDSARVREQHARR